MSNATSNISSRMRHRVIIEQPDDSLDGSGGLTREWQEVVTLWAEITPLRGNERLRAMQLASNVTHRLQLRYHAGLTAATRIRWNDRIFNIQVILQSEPENGKMTLLVEEEGLES